MVKFKSKSEVEKILPSKTKVHQVGEIYREIFSHQKEDEFSEVMPLEVALMWLGAYQIDSSLFPKEKCSICGKEEVLIPYMCGGSILSGLHTIHFYCTNCHEKFVTNNHIDYFRKIYRYVQKNRVGLKSSSKFIQCSKI